MILLYIFIIFISGNDLEKLEKKLTEPTTNDKYYRCAEKCMEKPPAKEECDDIMKKIRSGVPSDGCKINECAIYCMSHCMYETTELQPFFLEYKLMCQEKMVPHLNEKNNCTGDEIISLDACNMAYKTTVWLSLLLLLF